MKSFTRARVTAVSTAVIALAIAATPATQSRRLPTSAAPATAAGVCASVLDEVVLAAGALALAPPAPWELPFEPP